jgi:hypothetical protein
MFRTEVRLKCINVVYTTTVETRNQKNDGFEADEPFHGASHAKLQRCHFLQFKERVPYII